MPPLTPNDDSLMSTIRKDINKWIGKLNRYFEDHDSLHIIIKAILLLVGFLASIADILPFAKEHWSTRASYIILFLLVFFAFIVDYGHVQVGKRRLAQLNRVIRLLENMTKIIRGATDLQKSNYKIIDTQVEHDIYENGDVNYKRTMEIGCIDTPVYWVRIPIGVVDGTEEDKAADLGIKVVNPVDNGKLPWVVIEETDQKKVLAILLDPPATAGVNSSFSLSLTWRGAYLPLITDCEDKGKTRVEHQTEKTQVKFIAPVGLKFASMRVQNGIGRWEIHEQEDGRSVLTWKTENIPVGTYPYTLICKRKEP
jgi:hypothetical protein